MSSESSIALEGSAATVAEFFEYSVYSILYHRGIYPEDDFKLTKAYGGHLLVSIDDDVKDYVQQITSQVKTWVSTRKLSKLVLLLVETDTLETVERWQFDVHSDAPRSTKEEQGTEANGDQQMVDENEIALQIRAVMRQITGSVTFLPTLEGDITFKVLVYADHDIEVPSTWGDSAPSLIKGGGETVRLKSFATTAHQIEPIINYR
ncbi:Mitotic spindle checkpoint component mad2, partial [Apophysomyces sp. BC1021]